MEAEYDFSQGKQSAIVTSDIGGEIQEYATNNPVSDQNQNPTPNQEILTKPGCLSQRISPK